jgi:hypothetical protein
MTKPLSTKRPIFSAVEKYLQKKLVEGEIVITRKGLLSQDYETRDGHIKVTSDRKGGGFTAGTTLYYIKIPGKNKRLISLIEAYKLTAAYLKNKEAACQQTLS